MSFIIDLRNKNKINTDLSHVWGIFDYLIEKYNYKMENIADIKMESKKDLSKYFLEKYHQNLKNIIIFSHLKYLKLDFEIPNGVNFIWYGDDLHCEDKDKILPKVNKFILSYAYAMNIYHPGIINNKYYFPHSFYFDIDFNENPIKKSLVSGRKNVEFYPKRTLAAYLYEKSKNIYVDYLAPNVSYTIGKNDSNKNKYIFGKKYIEELNKYLICFACDSCGKTPYILAKVFEIMSSGALLLYAIEEKNKKYFEKLGFIDGQHYISCPRNRIKMYIEKYVNPINLQYVNQVRRNGYEFVKKYHSYKNRAELFHKIVNDTAEMEEYSDGVLGTKYLLAK